MEHRIQLHKLRRTHLVPDDEADLRRLGRGLGFRTEPGRQPQPGVEAARHGGAAAAREALLPAAARRRRPARHPTRPGSAPTRPAQRLQALGYADPAAALRHLEALASGVSRKAAIQRTLLPVLLGWFADSADPDAGLLGFRKVSDALGKTPWYLRLLRDEGAAAQRLARVLSSGRLAPDLLMRAPEAVALLGSPDGLTPARPRARWSRRCSPRSAAPTTAEQAIAAVRGVRRRELFRTAAGDLIDTYGDDERSDGPVDPATLVDRVGTAVYGLTSATLAGALRAAVNAVTANDAHPLPTRFAVIAMGRFGGRELGYGSDADVLFVHEPREGADSGEASRAAAGRRRRAAPAAPAPHRRPAAAHRRRPAARGQERPAGAHPRRRTPRTTAAGRWSGRARRCCGPRRSRATRASGSASSS